MSLKILMRSAEPKRRSSRTPDRRTRSPQVLCPSPLLSGIPEGHRRAPVRRGVRKARWQAGAAGVPAAMNRPGGFCVLELDEQHVRGRDAGVLARVGLGWEPVGAARFHNDITRALANVQPALEC